MFFLGHVDIDKLKKEIESDDVNITRKVLRLTEEKLESITISNNAKYSVFNETKMEFKQYIL